MRSGNLIARVRTWHAILGLALIVSSGCTNHHSHTEVRVATFQVVGCLPYFVAVEQGLFDKADLKVRSVEFTNSNDAVNALLSDQIDIIPAVSLVPVINVELKQPGTLRLFSHSRATPDRASDSIVVTKSSSLSTYRDLAGRRIGVFPGTTASRILQAFLKKRGVETKDIHFVPLASALQLNALASGAVDAVYGYEPTTTAARLNGGFRVLYGSVYASLANPSVLGGAVVSRTFEVRMPDAAARTIGVFDAAVRWMREQPDQTRVLLQRSLFLSPQLANAVTIVESGLSTENDVPNLGRMIDLLFDIGEIPARIEPERLIAK